ncbi:malonyl-ACP O-methyltransferase BioC [bacterium]
MSIIKNNFSKSANNYDKFSFMQDFAGNKLIHMLKGTDPSNIRSILDIGCGTGTYTIKLKQMFPNTLVTGIDFSDRMIKAAKLKFKDIDFIVQDGESPKFMQKFDIITSNATMQWFNNLENSISTLSELLTENGFLVFSIFGPKTYEELNSSLKTLFNTTENISAANFKNKEQIFKILNKHFKNVTIDEQLLRTKFKSIKELLKRIKYTGTSGHKYVPQKIWTKHTLNKLNLTYLQKNNSLISTSQIFFIEAS